MRNIIFSLLLFSMVGFCQAQRHHIELGQTASYFFDGNKMRVNSWKLYNFRQFPYAISYTYEFPNERISIGANYRRFVAPHKDPANMKAGDISGRYFDQYALRCSYQFWQYKGLSASAPLIFSYRRGMEGVNYGTFWHSNGWPEGLSYSRPYGSFGIGAGIKLLYELPYPFTVSLENRYERYFEQYKSPPPFAKTAAPKLYTLQLSIGYKLGKRHKMK